MHTQSANATKNQVDMTASTKGIYFVKVVNGDQIYQKRVVNIDRAF